MTDQGQRRRKPVTGNARGSQNTALPFCTWLGCALERFRIHFSRVSMDAVGKQTQAVFTTLKMASCLHFLPLGDTSIDLS